MSVRMTAEKAAQKVSKLIQRFSPYVSVVVNDRDDPKDLMYIVRFESLPNDKFIDLAVILDIVRYEETERMNIYKSAHEEGCRYRVIRCLDKSVTKVYIPYI